MRKLFGLLSLLVIASMVLSACGAPPAAAPMPSGQQYFAGLDPLLAQFPSIIDHAYPKVIDKHTGFRGMDVYATDHPGEWRIKGEPGNGMITVAIENGDYVFRRYPMETNSIGVSPIEDQVAALKAQVAKNGLDPNGVWLEGDVIAVKDFGVTPDYYLGQLGNQEILAQVNEELIRNRLEMYDLGFADLDVKYANDVLGRQAAVVDWEFVIRRNADGSWPERYWMLGERKTYESWLRGSYEYSRGLWAKVLPNGDEYVPRATPVAPAPLEQPASTRVQSTLDGSIYELTSQEMVTLKAGGDHAIRMLEAKGMRFPPLSFGERAVQLAGDGVRFAGDVYMGYVVIDTLFDSRGLGNTIQLNTITDARPLFSEEPTDPQVIERAAMYDKAKLTGTAAFYQYFDTTTMADRYTLLEQRFWQPYGYRLDQSSIVAVPGFAQDFDAYPPIAVFFDQAEGAIVWHSLQTGQEVRYYRTPDGTWYAPNTNQVCMAVDVIVYNQYQLGTSVSFDICIYSDFVVFAPAWTYR